jgi:HAE1 family hydrophobic/amphiphilic exporter-1
MVAAAIVAFGAVSLSRLPVDLLPEIGYPSLTVRTEFPDTAPGEVENLVTRPVEEAVGVVRGLLDIHSVSRTGVSEVTLQFDWGADMDDLSLEVREKLDRVELPLEAESPIVLRFDPALDPVLRLALTGSDDLALLRRVAEKEIKERLETLDGIAAAVLKGGVEEEVHVEVDQGKLGALGLGPEDVGRVLATSNVNRPGGSLESIENQYLVRTLNEFDTVEEMAELTITPSGRIPVRLGEVATVRRAPKDREEITRVNGRESVEIAIHKEGDANTVAAADAVRESLERIRTGLPEGMDLTVLFDQSRFVRRAIGEVRDAAIVGGVLSILVLFLFLRDVRPTLVIATSIPLSVLVTFILMYRLDVSLNLMSLGGLTLGVGMLVDASIVVLESIDRRRASGVSRARAAVEGTAEVGGAVFASVLTTVAVFLPIVFVEGIAGQIFRDQALTVTFSQLASLLVSLTLVPMLSAVGATAEDLGRRREEQEIAGGAARLGRVSRKFEEILRACLGRPRTTLLVAAGLFGVSLAILPTLGSELVPEVAEGEFHFEVVMPEGAPLAATDRTVRAIEGAVSAEPGVATTYATVGSRLVAGGLSMKTKDENLGQVNVVLEERSDEAADRRLTAKLRDAFARLPGVDTRLGRPAFFSLETPVEVVFYGEDLEALRDYSLRLRPLMAAVPGLADVRASLEAGNPELTVRFDRDRLAAHGLTLEQVSAQLHDRVQGAIVSRLRESDRHLDIRVRNRLEDRSSVADVTNLVVAVRDGVPITLDALADVEATRGPAEIHRVQQSRAAILSAEVAGRSLGAVSRDVERVLASNPPPRGVTVELAGQNEEMRRSFASLVFALGLASFLVYLVMAGTFESLVHPFLIMFTLPLGLVGVVLGLLLGGFTINIMSLIGMILLAGIVVNNAIVLIDAVNRFRRTGLDKVEALVQAAHVRMRPIVMTTAATVLGLVPMAAGFGEGAELRQPLAVVVSVGLIVGTVLTLVVIPCLYLAVPSRVSTLAEEENLERAIEEASRLAHASPGGGK